MKKVRSLDARLGVTALNLIMPGLGLLRVGAGRLGAVLAILPLCWMLCSIVLFSVTQRATFGGIVTYLALTFLSIIAIYVAAIALTWRRSALLVTPQWSGRWFVLAGIAVTTSVLTNLAVMAEHRFYKPFYLPSESMAPTIGKLDRIVADMHTVSSLAIGDLVLAPSRSTVYVKRVIALPGDRVSIAGDISYDQRLSNPSQVGRSGSFPWHGRSTIRRAISRAAPRRNWPS